MFRSDIPDVLYYLDLTLEELSSLSASPHSTIKAKATKILRQLEAQGQQQQQQQQADSGSGMDSRSQPQVSGNILELGQGTESGDGMGNGECEEMAPSLSQEVHTLHVHNLHVHVHVCCQLVSFFDNLDLKSHWLYFTVFSLSQMAHLPHQNSDLAGLFAGMAVSGKEGAVQPRQKPRPVKQVQPVKRVQARKQREPVEQETATETGDILGLVSCVLHVC